MENLNEDQIFEQEKIDGNIYFEESDWDISTDNPESPYYGLPQ